MNICVRGPLLSMSGYGNHTRQVYRWLLQYQDFKLSTQILPWGITPWHVNPDSENGMIGKIMSESINMDASGFDISFQVQLPNEWDPNLAKFNVGVTAAVETDICNPAWIQSCNRMNLVVVPSQHTKQTIESSGTLTTPIVVIPESFPDSLSETNIVPFELNVKTKFNFLIFGQLTGNNAFVDRKNTFFGLKWIIEEFANDPDVGIIIKTNHGRNTSIDRTSVRQVLKKIVNELNSTVPVYLLHGTMSDAELAGLYTNDSVKALVAPTRGEGYGLPLLEAAASGLPVLATNWSGHKDFLNAGKWIKFDYKLSDVPKTKIDSAIFIEGSKWAEVDEADFKNKIRKFRKRSSQPQQWAEDLSKTLQETHSFEAIAQLWSAAMSDYIK
ncbi:MAG: glycosyltransferase [Rhodobacteraceae bacterium]|nr:glycosyltransferase [Paracoccaceae bacterium]